LDEYTVREQRQGLSGSGNIEQATISDSDVAKVRPARRSIVLNPMLIILALLVVAVALTHAIPAGKFERSNGQVVAGTYNAVPKVNGLPALLSAKAPADSDKPARAAGIVALFRSIPAGMTLASSLIFMVMFVGGTFGVLRATGAIDAGVDRLLHLTSGNRYLLGGGLLVLLSCGSTFLGFSSEYVAMIPLVMELGRKLQLPNLFAPAVVALADFIGYNASVTNPIALGVAQPLAGVPVFSGILPRLAVFAVMLALGLAYLIYFLRRLPRITQIPVATRLSARHLGVLLTLVTGGAALVVGTGLWSWHTSELAAVFIALGIALALVGGLSAAAAADAFLEGMKVMLLPCLLIGVAGAIGIMLQASQVLDSIVEAIATIIQGHGSGVVAMTLMGAEMVFGILIPSVSAKAAVSLPIITPIAHLAGVSGQVAVSAVLLGSGLTNMITPTNPLLLAFLAAAKVDYLEWLRFIAPLFAAFCLVGLVAVYLMAIGA
jgi:uncharacterized ion transporter superfamily protein YfcC